MSDRESAVRIVAGNRFFRSAFIALFVSGVGFSATTPQLTLFLVRELDASLPVAGLYYLTNLAAPVAGYVIGSLSDRREDRLTLVRVCAVVGGVGWLAMSLASQLWMPFVISTVALSVAGSSMAQLFAATRDELSREPTTADNRVVATIRMAFTAGWVLGPVLGSWFGGAYGLRPLLVATAICTLAQVVPLGRQRVQRFLVEREPTGATVETAAPRGRMVPLLVFTALTVLVMSGDTIKFAYLPLYMADDLHISDELRGIVISIQPLLEFALMPLAGRLADRFGPLRILTVGAALGVAANLAYATSGGVMGLFLGQALTAVEWAALAALGVTVAQQLCPEGVGKASGIFLSSIMVAGALGGVVGGFGAAQFGLPEVFFVPTALTALGTVGLLVLRRRLRRDQVGEAVAADVVAAAAERG
jgi:SET family sugar efflux transporter-like MFS transporter